MNEQQLSKAFEDFVENVWPVVVERLGLPEDAEPTQEEFELWDGSQIDAVYDYSENR